MAKILVVDDEIGIRELLREILNDEGHDVVLAEHAAAARAARQADRPDLVLLDIWMPDTDGVTLLKEWAATGMLTMPVLMMSGHGTIDTAVEAIRLGALDFLEKPIALQKLLAAVKRGLQQQPSKTQSHLTLAAFTRSAPLRDLRKRLDQVMQKSRVVLLRVGAGALSELCARSLQPSGGGWLDLGALTQPIELHLLEANRGGIVYIDNLALLTRSQQRNLAFVVERLDKYDLRLITAASCPPEELLQESWDALLVRRLFEVTLVPPSLLELKDDVPEIANQLLSHLIETGQISSHVFSTAALNALRNIPWMGGFAELRAAIRSLALGALDNEIGPEEVNRFVSKSSAAALALPLDEPLRVAREAFERLYFEHHLKLEDGNITRVAEKSGLERTHLYRKLKQLGIPVGRKSE